MDLLMTGGRVPTLREIGDRLGSSSTNGTSEQLARLRLRGLIEAAGQGKSRSTKVTDRGWGCWAEILSERLGRTVTAAEARIYTHLWLDLRAIGPEDSVSALSSLIVHLGGDAAATSTP